MTNNERRWEWTILTTSGIYGMERNPVGRFTVSTIRDGLQLTNSPQGALVIEDNESAAKVTAKMLEAGVPVRELFPD